MPNPVQQPFVLYRIVVVLEVLELGDRFHPCHGPVRELPRFRPADVHIFGADDHNDNFEVVVHDRGAKARTCVGRDASLDTVDAALSQHKVGIVPLVGLPVSVGVLLHLVKLCAHHFPELWEFHAHRGQLGDV